MKELNRHKINHNKTSPPYARVAAMTSVKIKHIWNTLRTPLNTYKKPMIILETLLFQTCNKLMKLPFCTNETFETLLKHFLKHFRNTLKHFLKHFWNNFWNMCSNTSWNTFWNTSLKYVFKTFSGSFLKHFLNMFFEKIKKTPFQTFLQNCWPWNTLKASSKHP